jgi:hypothetical protein
MKRFFTALMLVMLLSLGIAPTTSAGHDTPPVKGGCPKPFGEPHPAHPHDLHHERHIGTDADQNGDGYICVKHISPDKHLHIDNNVPN